MRKGILTRVKNPPLIGRFVIFSVIFFLFILIAGSLAFLFLHRQINKSIVDQKLSQLLKVESIKLESLVAGEITIALKMATSPIIRRHFQNPSDVSLKNIAFEEIAAYRKAFTGDKVFWISDADKGYYFEDKYVYTLDTSQQSSSWYNDIMSMKFSTPYSFNINFDVGIKRTMLWVNVPVFDDNRKPIGITGTGIDLSGFVEAVYKDYLSDAEMYLFNAVGEITGCADVNLINDKVTLSEALGSVGADVFSRSKTLNVGETQAFTSSLGEVAIRAVPTMNWYIMAVKPITIVDYKTSMTALFLAMIAVIAATFVVFNIFIARLIKPLRKTMAELESRAKEDAKRIEEISNLTVKAENASKAKSVFLAKMSHEIRTPMNAIIGMAELALRKDMPDSVRENVVVIKQSGVNLLSIINDILDFSKIESGKMEIVPTDYLFSSLVNDVISIIRMRVIDSPLRFVVNLDGSIPNALTGDETRIRQILLNVLNNAVKYCKEGFVSMSASGEVIDDVVRLTIDITDTGVGIKPENIDKLFVDFVQLDLTANRGVEGTGLGLAITKSLVSTMGGDISVVSEYGAGSTFTITLPQKIRYLEHIAQVHNPETKSVLVYEPLQIYADSMICAIDALGVYCTYAVGDESFRAKLKDRDYTFVFVEFGLIDNVRKIMDETGSNAKIVLITGFGDAVASKNYSVLAMPVHSISVANVLNGVSDGLTYSASETIAGFIAPKATVLVVDDINTNLKICEGLLLPYKMNIDLCMGGQDAIELVKRNYYDIVFMDHMMPEMDGVEATHRIRDMGNVNGRYSQIPIVALTANAMQGARDMFLNNGFSDFLSKPIDTAKLNAVLEKWLPKEKQEKGGERVKSESKTKVKVKIEGVDVLKGISQTGGTVENYLQTLAVFRKDGVKKLKEIKKSLETDNYPLYTTYVHALKSAAASCGAFDLSEAARELEVASRQEDISFIRLHNPQFLISLELLLNNIGACLDDSTANGGNDGEAKSEVDFGALKSALRKLKESLDAFDDSTAIDEAVSNLQQYAHTPQMQETVENISQNIATGGYEEAEAAINNLLMELQ